MLGEDYQAPVVIIFTANLWKEKLKRLNFRFPSKPTTFSALDSLLLRDIVRCNHPAMKYLMIASEKEEKSNSRTKSTQFLAPFAFKAFENHNKQIFSYVSAELGED